MEPIQTPSPVVQLLQQALLEVSQDARTLRRIDDGRIHENMLVAGVCRIACEHSVPACMTTLYVSAPAPAGGEPSKRDYQHERTFLEVEGALMGLELSHFELPDISQPIPRLAVVDATSREALLARDHPGATVRWEAVEEIEWMQEGAGRDTVAAVVKLPEFLSRLQQSRLSQTTPVRSGRKGTPRL